MKFNRNHYMEASASRVEAARRLHNDGNYSEAIYLAGVSVECLLRSLLLPADPAFDGRHGLPDLYKKAQIESLVPEGGCLAGQRLGALEEQLPVCLR